MAGRPESGQQARAARQLLASRLHGVLSTLSADMPGYPFGSVVPYCLDGTGAPVFLLSHLSQHTINLAQESRSALTIVAAFEGDVQQAGRLTAVGRVQRLAEDAGVAERYFRYFPQSRFYRESLGFRFFGLEPERWHWNGGFATARWFGNDRILRANPFAGATEEEVATHVAREHRDVLERRLAAEAVAPGPDTPIRVCGMDSEGMDIGAGDRVVRISFPGTAGNVDELRALLSAL